MQNKIHYYNNFVNTSFFIIINVITYNNLLGIVGQVYRCEMQYASLSELISTKKCDK